MSAIPSKTQRRHIDTIVIGAGHTGLAVSHCLNQHAVDHLVLERGEVANSWRTERWDSLKLFTPNWMASLPGHAYSGNDPDGYMGVRDVISFVQTYADISRAPVKTQTTVESVTQDNNGYCVSTDKGQWYCRSVVIASGACNLPSIPGFAESIPGDICQLSAIDYKNPQQLQPGGVMVVGASATGLQLAEEIHQHGHAVVLSAGEHVRMPRTYRGRDIQWWMYETGILDDGLDDVDDINRARGLPSPQLVGSGEREILDLNTLTDMGIELVGRLMACNNGVALFSGSLRNVCALADLKMNRLLEAIDQWVNEQGRESEFQAPQRFLPTRIEDTPRLSTQLDRENIRNIVWATGYRPDFSWLNVPVLDHKRRVIHQGGVTQSPGMYIVGMPFLRRRKSSFIHGIEDDARYITGHLQTYLNDSESR